MQPRQILIVGAVVIVAFAAAFGIASTGGDEDSKASAAPAPEAAEVIEVERAKVPVGVSTAANLPALRVPEKKPKDPAPSSDSGTPPAGPTTPDPGQTPATPAPAPQGPTTPAPQPQPQPQPEPESPIIGGGED